MLYVNVFFKEAANQSKCSFFAMHGFKEHKSRREEVWGNKMIRPIKREWQKHTSGHQRQWLRPGRFTEEPSMPKSLPLGIMG